MNATHVYGADSLSPPWTPDWRTRAACLSVDPELFFPLGEPGSPNYERASQDARAVCAACPVMVECLEDALRAGDRWAIRGGLDPDERKRQFPAPPPKRKPKYPCAVCGVGMGAPKRKGGFEQRYCSDECRLVSKRRRQNEYDQRKREVTV